MSAAAAEPLGFSSLIEFWQRALQLVDGDVGEMQEVITLIASEGGMLRVAETIGQDFESMNEGRLKSVFEGHLLPFFRVITHRNVTASAILHTKVMSIYTVVFGSGGETAIKLLANTVRHLSTVSLQTMDENGLDTGFKIDGFEATAAVIDKIIEVNTTAKITPELVSVVEMFDSLIQTADSKSPAIRGSSLFLVLDHVKHRLRLGKAIEENGDRNPTQSRNRATFNLSMERPGDLSEQGRRHDNDKENVKDISILPTIEEMRCSREEYIPSADPYEWHLEGLSGIIDRQFRLLREDTIGQLRDAVRCELKCRHDPTRQGPGAEKDQSLRTFTYSDAFMVDIVLDDWNEISLVFAFRQPKGLRAKTVKQRREWWESSKRLSTDALVCIVSGNGLVLFLVVMGSDSKETPRGFDKHSYNVWSDPNHSYVVTKLANPGDAAYLVTHLCRIHNASLTLVEFPGVLLPAFLPILKALQQMSVTLDMPFASLIAPTESDNKILDVSPPRYAMKPGFYFDLSVITKNNCRLRCSPGEECEVQRLQDNSTLDHAQANAVMTSLNRSLALVQGPPGTGKSYTGVALIRVLLHNKRKASLGPIICVCFTNHALDQLLEHLLDSDVKQIVRIGAGSKSSRLQDVNLRELAKALPLTKTERRERGRLRSQLESESNEVKRLLSRLTNAGSDEHVEELLRGQFSSHHQQLFAKVDGDGFTRIDNGRSSVLRKWIRGCDTLITGKRRSIAELRDVNIFETSSEERRLLYHSWLSQIESTTKNHLQRALASHNQLKEDLALVRMEADLRVLQGANIIGMTTSGLAQKLNHLRRLESKVLVCEEAGEVLEAHLLTAMLPKIEHAIFIGDHEQLRPQVGNAFSIESHTGKRYMFDVSLFERLVAPRINHAPRIPFCTLEVQRRMHPSISHLVGATLYPRLKDYPSVTEYPEVVGMRQRLFWMHHERMEDERHAADTTTRTNKFEVDMVAALVSHLVRQGVYRSNDIAVITPYLGQLRKIKTRLSSTFEIVLSDRDIDELSKDETGTTAVEDKQFDEPNAAIAKSNLLQALRLATVDNFQGEEAKVIIVSLVRSNKKNNCGFLKTSNRINVLLSRAQHGMYILGNANTARHVRMWDAVLNMLEEAGNFGNTLELCCPRHPDTPMLASTPEHFINLAPEAGCSLACAKQLRCGHACVSKCHSDLLHQSVFCQKPCTRPRKECDHNCPLVCGDTCASTCAIPVDASELELPCGHRQDVLPCHQYLHPELIMCDVIVHKEVPNCGHVVAVECCVDVGAANFQCHAMCGLPLSCGHTCIRKCYECSTRDEDGVVIVRHGPCRQICGKKYNSCRHHCAATCHGEASGCPLCTQACEVRCCHSQCSKKCSEPCTPCAEATCDSCCEHSKCSMPCAAPCDRLICGRRCSKTLSCGHRCKSKAALYAVCKTDLLNQVRRCVERSARQRSSASIALRKTFNVCKPT